MKQFFPVLKRSSLFAGVGDDDLAALCDCLQAKAVLYQKGETVFHRGDAPCSVMILAQGSLLIQRDDYWGNRSILGAVGGGEIFGEAYAAPDSGVMENDVVAAEDSVVVFFDSRKLLTVCPSACRYHTLVIRNLFYAVSEKNRKLVRKLGHMAKRTTREKLLSYLSEEATRQNSATFSIPYNRQQLADFLAVDRSAMSNELSKMRDEGLLTFQKNHFTLFK